MPYLTYIKSISKGWPHISYLADFMEVSTAPPKWKFLTVEERQARASRTHVSIIEFGEKTVEKELKSTADLVKALQEIIDNKDANHACLFVVEDLSRDMIEALGAHLDIDPLFFRSHISDYQWYNTRDPWIELPDLNLLSSERTFHHLQYRHARHFKTFESLDRAKEEAGRFNVLRRMEWDGGQKRELDGDKACVALARSKAGYWFRRPDGPMSRLIGQ